MLSRTAVEIVEATMATAMDTGEGEITRLKLSHASLHRRRDKLRLSSDKIVTKKMEKEERKLYSYCIGMRNH